MICRLAWQFGCVDPDEFAATVPARVVEKWAEYLSREPDTGTRLDAATGIIAASNLWPHGKKGRKVKPRDLMPKWGRKTRRSSGQHLLAWAASRGAKVDTQLAEKLLG